MKYHSKEALIDDIGREHGSLCLLLAEIQIERWSEPGVWGDQWTLSDLVAHLAEWQRMFLSWYEYGLTGTRPALPAAGYKWNELPRLNRAIWEKHRGRTPAEVRMDFESGFNRILEITSSLSSDQLFQPGRFEWTGKNALTTYLGANTASHYRFAAKVIKRWLKRGAESTSRSARERRP